MSEECIDTEIRKMLKEKLDYEIRKHERLAEDMGLKKSFELLPKLRALNEVIETAQACTDILNYSKHIVPEQKRRTPRQEFMSHCMRSPEKDGEGKDLRTCSAEWKQR